ncbi:MAG: nitrile hydratase accessory protein [Pseudomonadota bacterium]
MNPPEPLPPDGPAFAAPWQAEVFALTVALNAAGHITWPEWAERFGTARADIPRADAADYFDHWILTLEALLVERGVARAGEIADLAAAWHRAATATPHGVPVLLKNDPERAEA